MYDLTNKKFGKLLVIERDFSIKTQVHWVCICDCKGTKSIAGTRLRSGKTKSCGQCNKNQMIGKRIGKWTVQSCLNFTNKSGEFVFDVICDCGNTGVVSGVVLRRGSSLSCGCSQKEAVVQARTTHGKSRTTEYNSWRGMIKRCYQPSHSSYKNYGALGIKVCDRWKTSFENFIYDMGPKPSNAHSIDRIDSKGNYEPYNCKWSTSKEQSNNTRNNIKLTFNNRTLTVAQWVEETGIAHSTVLNRIKRGWSNEEILTKPVQRHKN